MGQQKIIGFRAMPDLVKQVEKFAQMRGIIRPDGQANLGATARYLVKIGLASIEGQQELEEMEDGQTSN